MSKIKDTLMVDSREVIFHKREHYPLLERIFFAIILGSGVRGENVRELAQQIIQQFSHKFIDITVEDLQALEGIGNAKALQIVSAISSLKEDYENNQTDEENLNYVAEGEQTRLFDYLEFAKPIFEMNIEKIGVIDSFFPKIKNSNYHQLQNRRYIGSKQKLIDWIFSLVQQECEGKIFADIFAGTGIVGMVATGHFERVIINDFLFSNYVIYEAFLGNGAYDQAKIDNIIKHYNSINGKDLEDNYFSENYGGKYFSKNSSKIIGFIREDIEQNKTKLTIREYYILIASLIYSVDKIANTVGHYDAYFKKPSVEDVFFMRSVEPTKANNVDIFREDTNVLAKKIKADIVYIDPPYNSRQYSRFYHVLENLAQWEKPKLFGTALKPEPNNMSDYCRVQAKQRLKELINDIEAKHIVVSYNNTYNSKSNSSKNKITLEEIEEILKHKGETKIFEKEHQHFNAGNTDFNNHKEYLFFTKVKYEE